MSVSTTSSSTSSASSTSSTSTSTSSADKSEKTKTSTATSADKPSDKAASKTTTPVETAPRTTPTPEEAAKTRSDLEQQRTRDVQASFRRSQLDAALPAKSATGNVDLLANTPVAAPVDAAVTPDPAEALRAPVKLADTTTDFTRVDAYADQLAATAPDPTYHQGDYVTKMADALSGRVTELPELSDAERTRLLDRAHEHFDRSPDGTGDHYARDLMAASDPATASFIADDLADRAMVLTDRAQAAATDPSVTPAQLDPVIDRAQKYATEAALHNAADPAAFLDRLGPDASRFADALHVDRTAPPPGETTQVAARLLYEGAQTADPSVRDAFRSTLESRATGQPENPVEAEAWRRLSGIDPSTLGQADLRQADQLLRDHPPLDNGAAILGAEHPAVLASTALTERQPRLQERLAEENAVYRRAGFADDATFTAGTAEERAAFLSDVSGRIDQLSPRAADQALEALRLQREAGVEVPNAAALETALGRQLMISSGVDLAARLDHQMETAMAERGIIGEGWDGLRNTLGLESGSQAVTAQLDRLRSARDELAALKDFTGTDAELSAALATRLDDLQRVAQDTSQAVSGFIEQQDGLSTRGLGLLQAVGGGLETVAGVGLLAAPEPLSKVAGVAAVAVGVDDLQAGTRKLLTGEEVPTFRAQLAEQAALAAGLSPELAAGIGVGADLAPAGIALARGVYTQAGRLFATARGADTLADAAPLVDNFTDFMAARPREALNAVRGTRFTGTVADDAIAGLEAQGIKVVQGADARLDAMANAGKGRGPLGGFNHETGELLLRANPTYYEWFHESAHARQWLEMGKDGYQAQTALQREAHVYNEILAHSGQFNRLELRHAQNYIQRLADTEAHSLMASGRYQTSREIMDVLRSQGVPDEILLRIPREIFDHRPR